MRFDPVYTGLMVTALATGIVLARRQGRIAGVLPWQRVMITIGAIYGAAIAAKLPFIVFAEGSPGMSAWFQDGKTVLWALVGGYIAVEFVKLVVGVRVKTGDSFVVPLAVGIAIGRLSCLRAGCCFGTECHLPWAMKFADGIPRHPTQIYESIFHLAMAVVLFRMRGRGMFPGQLIKFYFLCYFAYRFVTEFIRPQEWPWMGLSFYQWSSAAFFGAFAVLWWWEEQRRKRHEAAQPVGVG